MAVAIALAIFLLVRSNMKYRKHTKEGGGEQGTMTAEAFAKKINDEVAEMTKEF